MDEKVGSAAGEGTDKMGTRFEIKLPGTVIVKMELAKNVPAEMVLERAFHLDEFRNVVEPEFVAAPDVSVPVTINRDSLPYALLTGVNAGLVPPEKASISVRIVEKRNIRIKLSKLEFLKNVFGEDASMKLIVFHDGALGTWQTEVEMEFTNLDNDAEGSIRMSENIEDLISQYGRPKRYRTAHGEVVSVSGNFTIVAKWIINARPKEVSFMLDRHQKFIMSKPFDHQVELISSSGPMFKVSKAMLAAHSEKIEKQMQFLPDDESNPRSFKTIRIYTGANFGDGNWHFLDERGLIALVRYVTMNSISMPLENPALTLELMMTASYNLIYDLEKAMALVLLAQPLELFDLETSVHLYWFASKRMEMEKAENLPKVFWNRLKVRALWNLKWTTREDLLACSAIQELFPAVKERDCFLDLIEEKPVPSKCGVVSL